MSRVALAVSGENRVWKSFESLLRLEGRYDDFEDISIFLKDQSYLLECIGKFNGCILSFTSNIMII